MRITLCVLCELGLRLHPHRTGHNAMRTKQRNCIHTGRYARDAILGIMTSRYGIPGLCHAPAVCRFLEIYILWLGHDGFCRDKICNWHCMGPSKSPGKEIQTRKERFCFEALFTLARIFLAREKFLANFSQVWTYFISLDKILFKSYSFLCVMLQWKSWISSSVLIFLLREKYPQVWIGLHGKKNRRKR